MGRGRKILVEEEDYSSSDSESRYGDPIRIERRKDVWRASSKSRPHKHAPEQQAQGPVIINNRLAIPVEAGGGRHQRANSTGGQPSPVILIPQQERSPSRSHSRHHHHHHYTSSSSSSRSRSHSRRPKERHESQGFSRDNLPYDIRKQLDAAAELEERQRRDRLWEEEKRRLANAREDQERKDKEKRDAYLRDMHDQELKDKEKKERYLRELHDQELRDKEREKDKKEKLLREIEEQERKAKDAKERYMRDVEEQERKDKEKRERYMEEYKEKQRKEEEKKLAIIREQEEKEREAKKKREELARQLKEEEEKKKREKEELEHRILLEAEEKKKKKEAEDKALKERILREAKEEEEKEKAKKKKAEEEFEMRVRAQALKAGWSSDYVEDLLGKEKEERRHHHHGHRANSPLSVGRRERELMIEYDRPTWIRISRKHILPETLEYYGLKWDYDEEDSDYIMIKEYVHHDLQRELFEHTKTIMKSRKLITPGYVKETETITTLKPRDERVIKKKGNQMYVVRKKSVSPAPRRLSFIG